MAIGVAFGLMGAFFLGGMYVAGALGCLSLIIMFFFSDAPLWNIMASIAWRGNTSFILTAVPLFVLMGELNEPLRHGGTDVRRYFPVDMVPPWRLESHQHCVLRHLRRLFRVQRGHVGHH